MCSKMFLKKERKKAVLKVGHIDFSRLSYFPFWKWDFILTVY